MAYKKIVCLLLVTILLVLPASANHQMSFSTDKAAYIRGQGNVVLTLQDADNDGAFVGWDGIAIYDVVGTEVANFDDNWQGQGHPIQAGKNLVWNWGQKYDVRAGAQNANNNGQLVPLGDYQAKAIAQKLNGGNQKTYSSNWFKIDSDNNNNGVPDSLDDDDNDGTKNSLDKCPKQVGSPSAQGCPDSDSDGFPDYYDNNSDGIPDEKVTDACPYAKEDKNGFHDDDGCPDEGSRAYKKIRAGAGGAALIGLIGAATFIAAPFTLGASLAFIGAEVSGSAMVGAWVALESDPPDLANYKENYPINKKLPQAFSEIQVTDSTTAAAKEFAEKSYLISEGLKALIKTIERHDGALQVKDYAAANKQAAAARDHSKYLKEQYLDLDIITDKFAKATDKYPKSKFPMSKFIELQNKVRKEGLPKEEIDFARKIGFTDTDIIVLTDNFVNFDDGKSPDMHISKYLRAWKPYITKYHVSILDLMSKTFGANLYMAPNPSDVHFRNGITDFGVYYENVPSTAKTFSFVVTYDKKLKFIGCKIISGDCNVKKLAGNKLLVNGSIIEPVNYGSHGHLLDLKFKKSFWSWFDQSNRYVLEVGDASEDMKDWLGSSNFNSLCEYAPKSLICSNNIKK